MQLVAVHYDTFQPMWDLAQSLDGEERLDFLASLRKTLLRELDRRPITYLALSVRATNALRRAGVETIGGIAKMTTADILGMAMAGGKVREDVIRACAEIGMPLPTWEQAQREDKRTRFMYQ